MSRPYYAGPLPLTDARGSCSLRRASHPSGPLREVIGARDPCRCGRLTNEAKAARPPPHWTPGGAPDCGMESP
eukprot:6030586-Pyramimonas_sp.AAC.1